MVVCSIGDIAISVLNLYAPNEENETIFKNIANVISSNAKGMVLMGGQHGTEWQIRQATTRTTYY